MVVRTPRQHRLLAMILAGVVVLGASLASVTAWAMRVSPMVSELSTSGAGAAARVEVGNVGSAALPFETMITRMEMDADGDIVETPADEDFLVFPPQGLVPVGGRQVVRVQWVGSPTIDASQAYYLWVKQLPVATDPNPTDAGGAVSVQVLYTMKALIVVAPPGAQPRVEVVSATPTMIASNPAPVDSDQDEAASTPAPIAEPGVEIVVANTGKRYALMSGATWVVEGTDKNGQVFRREYAGGEISQMVGVGYLAPLGGKRTFKLPTGGVELDPAKPVSVRFAR